MPPLRPASVIALTLALASCGRPPDAPPGAAAAAALSAAPPPTAKAPEALADEAEQALDRGDAELALARADAALRALEPKARAPRRDRALEIRCLVAAAGAENDLGRSDLALPRAERALRLDPGEPAAARERALALWELCRFEEAEAAFRRVLVLAPEDPWALHQLGLAAERRGQGPRARELFARASRIAPTDFPPEVAVDAREFADEVKRAIASLPEPERRALAGVPLELADLPLEEDLGAVEPPLSPSLLGLFRGPSEGEPCLPDDGPVCRSIVLYRKNLARFTRTRAELARQVRVTLLHELGHLHGEDDDALRRRGLE